MAGGEVGNGGRVTTRDLYEAVIQQNNERAEMERRIIAKMDTVCDLVSRNEERIKHNKEDIESLKTRSNTWDIGNTIGVIIAGVITAFTAQNK